MKFQIEDNIPVPAAGGRSSQNEYPFASMAIGQSIFEAGINVKQASSRVAAYKKQGIGIAIRAETRDALNEAGEQIKIEGVRMWRVEPAPKSNRGRKAKTTDPVEAAEQSVDTPVETAEQSVDTPVETQAPAKTGKAAGKVTKPTADNEY